MATQLLMKHPTIQGDSLVPGHEGEIELYSLQFGLGREVATPTGGSAKRQASAPSVSDVVVTKLMDRASVPLFREAAAGKGASVTIAMVEVGGTGKPVDIYRIHLENVLVSGFSQSSGGDRPSESLSLNFTKIVLEYRLVSPPLVGGWDLSKGIVV